jgi:hypothetical protein
MAEPLELMVGFRRGIAEDAARKVVERAGATVRRRMRTDSADEVMLLIRVADGALEAVEKALGADPSVARTERNTGGFRPMS